MEGEKKRSEQEHHLASLHTLHLWKQWKSWPIWSESSSKPWWQMRLPSWWNYCKTCLSLGIVPKGNLTGQRKFMQSRVKLPARLERRQVYYGSPTQMQNITSHPQPALPKEVVKRKESIVRSPPDATLDPLSGNKKGNVMKEETSRRDSI